MAEGDIIRIADLPALPGASLANPQNVLLVVQDTNSGAINDGDNSLSLDQLQDPAAAYFKPTNPITLPSTGSTYVLIDSVDPGNTITVPNGVTRRIDNVSTAGADAVIVSAGNSNTTLIKGRSIWVVWNGTTHDLTLSIAGGSGSVTVDDVMDDVSTNPVENNVIKAYIDSKTVVDDAMDSASANPVENRVVKAYIESLASNSGRIELYRNGSLQTDYGLSQTSPAEYGAAVVLALAAMQSGDTLLVRGVYGSGTSWVLSKSNVRVIFENSRLVSNGGSYSPLFDITGTDNEIEGLHVDGLGLANTLSGAGIKVTGDRNRLRNIESHRTRVGVGGNPSALYITGTDTHVNGYRSFGAGYSATRIVGALRTTIENVYVEDPLNRAFNVEGSAAMEYIRLKNWTGRYYTPLGEAGVFTNINVQGMLDRLEVENYDMQNGDVYGTGFSYAHAQGLQMLKCHGVRRAYFHRMRLWHGGNTLNAVSPSFRVPGLGEGATPEELHFEDCVFAGHLKLASDGSYLKLLRIRGTHICARNAWGAPMIDCTADVIDIENSTINGHNQIVAIQLNDVRRSAQRVRLVNSRVQFNNSSQVHVFHGNPDVNSVRKSTGFFEVHGNEYTNIGTGALVPSATASGRLAVTTNQNGDLLFDGNMTLGTGSANMPDPGAGPNFFGANFPAPMRGGVRIINTAYNENIASGVNSMPGWISALTVPLTCSFNADDTISATSHGFSDGEVVFFTLGSRNTRFAATFSTTDTVTATGHTFVNGDVVEFTFGHDAVPPETIDNMIWERKPYFVRDVSGSTFKLALTSGGAAIDITLAGGGTILVRERELPSALYDDVRYFVRDSAASTFKLALTSGGTAIDITDTGTGGTPKVICARWHALP